MRWPRTTAAVLVAASGLGVAGCSPAVPVTAATYATDPVCASIVLATPTSLGAGLDEVRTTAQASRAWGDVANPVVLRCGVVPPGPTTQRCVAVATPNGPTVDWLVIPDDPGAADGDTSTGWTFVTFGRTPAVEVRVPQQVAATHSTSFLDQLGLAVDRATVTGTCT